MEDSELRDVLEFNEESFLHHIFVLFVLSWDIRDLSIFALCSCSFHRCFCCCWSLELTQNLDFLVLLPLAFFFICVVSLSFWIWFCPALIFFAATSVPPPDLSSLSSPPCSVLGRVLFFHPDFCCTPRSTDSPRLIPVAGARHRFLTSVWIFRLADFSARVEAQFFLSPECAGRFCSWMVVPARQ
jgi:hypothetical protein